MPKIFRLINCPYAVIMLMVGLSVFSLAAAYTAQYAFGLQPCILCLYQRIPFALVIVLGVLGMFFLRKQKKAPGLIMLSFISVSFFVNAVIAAYHSGVERHWWPSWFEGCTVPDLGDAPDMILKNILAAPAVRCDEIPWADPILGLSMANYNAMMCAALAVVCALALALAYAKNIEQCHHTEKQC